MRRIIRILQVRRDKLNQTENNMTTTTLTTAPVAPLLDRLFKEADATSPASIPDFAKLSADERTRLMRSKTDYLEFYGQMKDIALPVSRETGLLLYMLGRLGVELPMRNVVPPSRS
jgi:hypothetical protein